MWSLLASLQHQALAKGTALAPKNINLETVNHERPRFVHPLLQTDRLKMSPV